jgi:hypothetical protein
MRKIAICATAVFLLAGSGTANAHWHGYRGYGWGAGAVAAGLVGGVVLGSMITAAATAPRYGYPASGYAVYSPRRVYYAPQYYQPAPYYAGGFYDPYYVGLSAYGREIRRQESGDTYR